MYKLLVALTFLSLSLLSSCKQDATKSAADIKTEVIYKDDGNMSRELRMIKNMKGDIDPAQLAQYISEGQRILAHRQKDGKSYQNLTNPSWGYDFIFAGRDRTKGDELAGRWVRFEDDLSYTYGKNDTTEGKGSYHYSIDSGLLLMVDNSPSIKPNEYTVKMFPKGMILQGTSTYTDNNYQIKMSMGERGNG